MHLLYNRNAGIGYTGYGAAEATIFPDFHDRFSNSCNIECFLGQGWYSEIRIAWPKLLSET